MICPICGVKCGRGSRTAVNHLIEAHSARDHPKSGHAHHYFDPDWFGIGWHVLVTYHCTPGFRWYTGICDSYAWVRCFCGWELYGGHECEERFRRKFAGHLTANGGLCKHYARAAEKLAWKLLKQ